MGAMKVELVSRAAVSNDQVVFTHKYDWTGVQTNYADILRCLVSLLSAQDQEVYVDYRFDVALRYEERSQSFTFDNAAHSQQQSEDSAAAIAHQQVKNIAVFPVQDIAISQDVNSDGGQIVIDVNELASKDVVSFFYKMVEKISASYLLQPINTNILHEIFNRTIQRSYSYHQHVVNLFNLQQVHTNA